MLKKHYEQMRRFILEALRAAEAGRARLQDDVPSLGPPWPYVAHDLIGPRVTAELSDPDKSRRQLVWRLKRLEYPYPERNKRHRTFYRLLRERGLLDLLLNPPLLWEIRMAWFTRLTDEQEQRLRKEKESQHGHPLEFHRKLMLEIAGHLRRLLQMCKREHVPSSWLTEYSAAIQKQLLREASIYYPQLLRWFKPASQIRPISLAVDVRVDLFHALDAALRTRNVESHKLAYQLTALISSPSSCIRNHKLDPDPEEVRRNVRDREKARKARRRNAKKTPA